MSGFQVKFSPCSQFTLCWTVDLTYVFPFLPLTLIGHQFILSQQTHSPLHTHITVSNNEADPLQASSQSKTLTMSVTADI